MEKELWPQNVGIVAIEVYFPSLYVDQNELEVFDGVSTGKYTIGLGQSKMGFCTDCEDINSLCLTVVQNLIEKNKVSYADIGRLEVGTETIVDKSKSVKTVLMQLFESSSNNDVEGIDTTNACFGGTSALFNAINWIESSSWDGRYALVVAGDIAVYATGNARCTGGAGAVAMLVGPNAPLVFHRGVRSIFMKHAYDFYKPDLSSEYPVVDGKLSVQCYFNALDNCCKLFKTKAKKRGIIYNDSLIEEFDGFIFHSPYCKLVQKSFGRLMLNDFWQDANPDFSNRYNGLEKYRDLTPENTLFNKDLEKDSMTVSKDLFEKKTKPSLMLANQVGNMYTPSVYGGLAAYIFCHTAEELQGKRVVLFSYGSGLASAMFSLEFSKDESMKKFIYQLKDNVAHLKTQLESRTKCSPEKFSEMMKLREEVHNAAPYKPVQSTDHLPPNTWYLTEIDSKHRRTYKRKHGTQNGSISINDDLGFKS